MQAPRLSLHTSMLGLGEATQTYLKLHRRKASCWLGLSELSHKFRFYQLIPEFVMSHHESSSGLEVLEDYHPVEKALCSLPWFLEKGQNLAIHWFIYASHQEYVLYHFCLPLTGLVAVGTAPGIGLRSFAGWTKRNPRGGLYHPL